MALDSLSVFDTRSDFAPLKACRTEAHHLLHDFDGPSCCHLDFRRTSPSTRA